LLSDVPVRKIREFEGEFLEFVKLKYPEMMEELRNGKITDDTEKILASVVSDLTGKYRK
jgi:F-type H+-transporting ATPase subunit alpha